MFIMWKSQKQKTENRKQKTEIKIAIAALTVLVVHRDAPYVLIP